MKTFLRFVLVSLLLILTGCTTVAPMTTHIDPKAGSDAATLVREVCYGQGRGLIHFEGVDSVGFKPFQVQKLFVSPGEHTVRVVYLAPGISWNVIGEGSTSVTHKFDAHATYIFRYRRTGPKSYETWIEPIDASRVEAPGSVCLQSEFEDSRYWQ